MVMLHNDKCYHLSDDTLCYKDASTACDSMGGNLADIKDSSEQQLLASYIQLGHNVSAWTSTSTSVSSFGTCDCGDSTNRQSAAAKWMQKSTDIDICLLLDSSVGYMGTYQSCKEQHQYVCESNVTSCQPNVCQNGGICSSCFDNSAVFCTCPQGFIGTFCETVNPCDPNPCSSGLTCVSQAHGFSCATVTADSGTPTAGTPSREDSRQRSPAVMKFSDDSSKVVGRQLSGSPRQLKVRIENSRQREVRVQFVTEHLKCSPRHPEAPVKLCVAQCALNKFLPKGRGFLNVSPDPPVDRITTFCQSNGSGEVSRARRVSNISRYLNRLLPPDGVRASSSGFCTASSCGAGWSCVEDGPTGYSCIGG
ncbi:hypothetical protein Bbelb_262980 [Branchiostoma belcheri]|nr:hypothetical protein Bbelb_262980 [Branchiostoma belcheri]